MPTSVGETIIKFGKHRGSPLREVPLDYLEWAYEIQAGKPDQQAAIAAYLGKWVPSGSAIAPQSHQQQKTTKPSKPAKKPKKAKQAYQQIESNSKSIDTKVYDCSHMFDPNSDWPGRQEWDGVTAPWLDQSHPLDDEYRQIVA